MIKYEKSNFEVQGNSIWYTGAEVEYSREYRLGGGSGLVGEGVI